MSTEGPAPDPAPLAITGPGRSLDPAEAVIAEAGAARNTLLQLIGQVASAAFVAGLTLYLVRALGASGFGTYALAANIGALLVLPAGLGLPWAIGRFLADHRTDPAEVRAIFRVGLRLQVPAALVVAGIVFAASGLIAGAYHQPRLAWPLRWMAASVVGQALVLYLTSVGTSVRRVSVGLVISVVESVVEAAAAIALVIAGGAAAGAALGKLAGYMVATGLGIYLTRRLLGQPRGERRHPRHLTIGDIGRYAGAMFIVDFIWSALAQLDVLLIGAILSSAAVGSFGAVTRILAVLSFVPAAVTSGVAPRLSLGGAGPDVAMFERALRFLIVLQGVVIPPLVIWAQPITSLLLGGGYHSAAGIMRVLAAYSFIGAPAALITVSVTYMGAARRRVLIVVTAFVVAVVLTVVLLHSVGVVGAAIADDVFYVGYVAAHLRICHDLVGLDLRRLGLCTARTLLAAAAAAAVLVAFGTDQLTVADWILGAGAAVVVYGSVLLVTGETSLREARAALGAVRAAAGR